VSRIAEKRRDGGKEGRREVAKIGTGIPWTILADTKQTKK